MPKTLDIIIPIYNEEKTVKDLLEIIRAIDFCGLEKNIILVNDASDDNTLEIIKQFNECKIINHKKNQGKGAAISTGIKNSNSDIIIIQDADLEYNPEDYLKLLPLIISGEADVVYGSRLKDKKQRKSFLLTSYFANKFLTLLTNLLFKTNITDMETCYKAFRRTAISDMEIKAKKFDFEPEITAKIAKKKLRLKEVAISYKGRKYHEGKKVKPKDALIAIFTLFYYRFFD